MSRGVRIVSRFPAPDCLQAYEPFQLKGSDLTGRKICFQTLPSVHESEWLDLQKAMARFFAQGVDGGMWPLEIFPRMVVFSLNLACNSRATLPGNFELFLQLCHSLEIDIYMICNQLDPVAVKIYTIDTLFYAHKVLLLPDELVGGIQRELRDPDKRMKWLSRIMETQQIEAEKVVFITDRVEDTIFASLCPHMISFCSQPHTMPIHGHIRSKDCSYLAYLVLGREITAVRRNAY